MVEWLEQLEYGTESRRKVVSSRLGFAMRRLENSLCRPSSDWVPFSNWGRLRQQKERDELRLSSAVSKIQWDSNPPPTALQLLGYGKSLPFLQFTMQNRGTCCLKKCFNMER